MQLLRPVHAEGQLQLDVRGSAGPGDDGHVGRPGDEASPPPPATSQSCIVGWIRPAGSTAMWTGGSSEAFRARPAPEATRMLPVSARPATAPLSPTSSVANHSSIPWWFSSFGTSPGTSSMPAP